MRFIVPLIILAIIIGGYSYFKPNLGSTDFNTIETISIGNQTTSASDGKAVLEANGARTYARITNVSDTVLYLTLGATTTCEYQKGIALNKVSESNNFYEITDRNMYFGIISVCTSTADKVLTTLEAN